MSMYDENLIRLTYYLTLSEKRSDFSQLYIILDWPIILNTIDGARINNSAKEEV